jgi:RHS repeat-associated protein
MASPSRRILSASVLALMGLGLVWALSVFSQSTPDHLLFGPTQYLRITTPTGEPNEYTDTFTVPVSVGAPFLLNIVNGEAAGQNRVLGAWIFVNDVEVVGVRDFAQQPAVIDRAVTLQPTTRLRVRLAGIPGSFLTISVFGTKILPTPATLTPNPLTITVGATGTLTATLSPTPTEAGSLSASSDTPSVATVPASVSFAVGQSSVPVPVTAGMEGNASITVSLHGGSASATVQVTPLPPTVTSLLPGTLPITQGGSGTLTVTISAAQTTNTTVTLSSTAPGIAGVPSSVTVPAGQTSAPLTVSANTPGTAQITASLNGTSATSTVTVTPAQPTVVALLPPANPVTLGATTTLTVTISAAQPTGTTVTVTATPSGMVSVPPSVTVPAGQTSAPVPVGTQALGTAVVAASLNGTTADAAVQVLPSAPAVVSVTPSPLTVVQEATGTLTVTLNAAPQTNTVVALSVDQATVLQVPASVTVPAGQTQGRFTVTGLALGEATVTATLNATMQTAVVQVIPPPPTVVALVPNPLAIQQGATGTFTLTTNAAQLTDTAIPLTNSAASVLQAPSSVTVPAGQTRVTFPVTGLILGSATVTAALNSTSVSATVQVTSPPTVVTGLTPATVTVPKGTPAVLHVAVSPTSTGPQSVSLTSSNTAAATVPATVPIPAGALGADFPVLSVGPGSSTITATLNGSAASVVVVTPADLVTLTLSPQTPTLYVSQPQAFTATGTLTDGTTQDLTTSVTWTSSNQGVATINASGVASALAAGTTTITAASGAISTSTTLTVLTPPALSLTPATATLRVGESLTMTVASAAPADPGGLTVTLSQSGTGSVTLPAPATVVIPEGQSSATFTVTGATAGSVTLTASAPIRLPASSALTVTPPPTITGFTPSQGRAGTNVTITGQNFEPVLANNQVTFNGVPASVLSSTSTTLIVTVPPTATTGPIAVTTASGTGQSATNFIVVPITAFSVTPALATLPTGSTQQVRAIATFADQTTLDVTSFTTWASSNASVASVTSGGLAQGAAQGTATITGTLGSLGGSGSVRVIADSGGGPLPPDPTLVAPPVDRTVATTLGEATAFLYTGSNPIQTGVAPGTIIATRVAVLRGLVSGRDGFPIPGVTITVLGHPEFGQTLTRPDGMFDLAVNGGGLLTVKYDKSGYLPAQRQVQAPWQDYARVPAVVLIQLDPQVTSVDLTSPVMQTARGSVTSDANGTRQATLLFAPGTTATITLPGGGTQALTTVHVRATEYTVGGTGPQAMPALLPQTSNYTYAVELSVDEAMAAGTTKVEFSQPVISYVENFLGFPVGKAVPAGFYDRVAGQWLAAPNGKVIKILSISGGLADVDTDGDGVADSGLAITTAERQRLASLYQPGATLWRVPVDRFSIWDFNWSLRLPPDATGWGLGFLASSADKCHCKEPASLLRVQNQVLDESIALTGTPFRLQYTSEREAGYRAAYNLTIPLSGASIPASLKRIELEVTVAGRRVTQSFPAAANQQYLFAWDGTDAYGRRVQGRQLVQVSIGYVYTASYQENNRFAEISRVGGGSGGVGGGGGGAELRPPILTGELSRFEVTVSQSSQALVGPLDAQALGLGGWSLSVHHNYDTFGRKLSLGDGSRRSVESLKPTITTAVAGVDVRYVAVGPDGSLYWAEGVTHRVRKRAPDGAIMTVAGNGTAGFSGDGGPATAAQLYFPVAVALGPDGSLYISDTNNSLIRKVDPSGIITTFAGGSVCPGPFPCDGYPAPQGQLNTPQGLTVAPDGSLYVADTGNARIRRVGPDGIITTVAGGVGFGFGGDGMPATQASLYYPTDVAVGPDGSLYIADVLTYRVRRVTLDGIIRTYAGGGPSFGGDGLPATQVALNQPAGVAVAPDGSVYIGEGSQHSVRRVTPDGLITTVAGTGTGGFSGDGGPAPQATLFSPQGVAIGPDGSLYIASVFNTRIRKVAPALPGFVDATYVIPSQDGAEVYVFNNVGKHLRTQESLTGAVTYQFAYNGNGLLASVTDVAGQVTTIERNGTGNPTAIVAPGGQRTTVTMDANGYLASITNPAGETTQLTASADGLLATLTDPRSGLHQYTYDAQGRLSNDQDPANGFTTLARTDLSTGWTVTSNTALNRTSTNQVTTTAIGDQFRTDTDSNGLVTTTQIGNGTSKLTTPDGTITTTIQGPDPRFGMQAPITKSLSVRLPTGLTSTLTTTRAAALSNPADPLSLTSQIDTLVINGRTYTSVFDRSAKTITTTTPAARTSTVTLDAQGRVIKEQVTGLEPVAYTYDAQGRLSAITQGTGASARTSTLSYDTKNQLTGVQDPLLRTVGFAYDLAGRITTQTLPDLRTIGYTYDGNGNVTSITPPGKPRHGFTYTSVDLESAYNPPSPLGGEGGGEGLTTSYTYNLDRQLTLVTRPDNQTIQLGYDTGGRLSTLTLPGSQVTTYAYGATTGTLSSITTPDSTLSYTYDGSLIKTTTWTGTVAGSVSRNYDTNFRIATQTVNGANTINFGYDNDSLLTSAGSLTITRNAQNGLISGSTLGSVTDTRGYSTFGELGQNTATVSGTPVLDVQYTRDKLGRITQKVETIGGVTDTFVYTYDTAGRLTDVTKNGAVVGHYTYDSNGNRLSQTDQAGTVNGAYDAQDRLLSYGNLQFTYTPNGELLTKTNPVLGQTATFTYDVLGNLKSVSLPDGTAIEYVVDGQNRRIGKKVNGTLVQGFLYQNQLNVVAELDGTGAVVSRFVYGTMRNVPDYVIKGGIMYRIISDYLGSPRLVINTTDGTVAERIDYDEFGNVIADSNPGFQPFGFAGGLYDQHTGLTRFGVRDYDAQVGRWTVKDPIRFGGTDTNLYGYALNNPIKFLDPFGLDSLELSLGQGTLNHLDNNGNIVQSWSAVSGPYIPGPLPQGDYTLSGPPLPVDPTASENAPYCDPSDNCWFQPLKPNFDTDRGKKGGRLGIHPDGNKPGTEGCIGVTTEDTKDLYNFLKKNKGLHLNVKP